MGEEFTQIGQSRHVVGGFIERRTWCWFWRRSRLEEEVAGDRRRGANNTPKKWPQRDNEELETAGQGDCPQNVHPDEIEMLPPTDMRPA